MKYIKKEEVKRLALAEIERKREEIISLGEEILRHPELGYQEYRTSALVRGRFGQAGLADIRTCALTGVRAMLYGNAAPDPVCLCVMGELDAVLSPAHPFADPATGAAHACGHNAQIAGMIGCAYGLTAVKKYLGGNVCFLAAPAEEYVQLDYRLKLRSEGRIRYLGGKQQLIAEGAFDDIDMAMMVHGETREQRGAESQDSFSGSDDFGGTGSIGNMSGISRSACSVHIVPNPVSSGFIGKNIRFTGKEAHAGGAPWDGVNALNAAVLAMDAIHMQRETFRDEDKVRVHPIITKGGDLVNTVPADVRLESYVRAASVEAMTAANEKVNRCINGAAYAIGAGAEIEDLPGYLPMDQNPLLADIFAANAKELLPDASVESVLPFCGSTDVGDLSCLLPAIQPTVSGFIGAIHSCDFRIADPVPAYLVPARLMAMTAIDLLYGDAASAYEIKRKYPRRTKEYYESLWNGILS